MDSILNAANFDISKKLYIKEFHVFMKYYFLKKKALLILNSGLISFIRVLRKAKLPLESGLLNSIQVIDHRRRSGECIKEVVMDENIKKHIKRF